MKNTQQGLQVNIGIRLHLCFVLVFSFLPTLQAKRYYQAPWGKDKELLPPVKKRTLPEMPQNVLMQAADWIICFHQKHLSPTTCKRSHFRPTSSHYTQKAIKRYGFWKGFLMGCDRLLRENNEPWVYKKIIHEDGFFKYDPAYEHKCISIIDQ